MKAWAVSDEREGLGIIVFAETRGKAKSVGRYASGLDFGEWIDISCRRMPELDGFKNEECCLDWMENKHIYWNAKWYEDLDCMRSCDECDRYWYQDIPESFIDEDGICVDCKTLHNSRQRKENR